MEQPIVIERYYGFAVDTDKGTIMDDFLEGKLLPCCQVIQCSGCKKWHLMDHNFQHVASYDEDHEALDAGNILFGAERYMVFDDDERFATILKRETKRND